MKILVCLSNVPDTTTKVKFTDGGSRFDPAGVQWVINPWDELALTRAIQLKEDSNNPVDKVTVLTVGSAQTEPTIRKALAIGADDAFRVDLDPEDTFVVAAQMAEVIRNNPYDIILCGIESADYNSFAVGGMLAEMLDLPSVSAVSSLELEGEQPVLTRDIDGGKEKVKVPPPFIAVVQKGIAREPRIAAMRGIMMARKKPLKVVQPVEVESLTSHEHFELPAEKPPCKVFEPEQVAELVDLLQNEAKVL